MGHNQVKGAISGFLRFGERNLFFVFSPRVFVIKIYAELTAWCIEVSPIGMNP
ncbi:hypothetical protein J6590_023192, partial [Homalodisca vitripennis]